MKRIYIYILFSLFAGLITQSCIIKKYEQLTHLTEEELEWITNRHVGEVMYFQTQKGKKDTVKVWNIIIQNSTNPINWVYYQIGGTEYIANACVELIINHNSGVNGNFYIKKKSNEEPIYFSTGFFMRWTHDDVPLKTISMQIGDVTMEDIMFFDENTLGPINEYNPSNPITSLAWSKRYGLVQYSFQDGTICNRINLK